jgi:hypothetical protein
MNDRKSGFPDVLQLQLKRFDYDGGRDRMVKIGALFFLTFRILTLCDRGVGF